MIIRDAKNKDIKKWQLLANEVADLFDSPDMGEEQSFIKYMKNKISKSEAIVAIEKSSDNLLGVIAFSNKNNRISWFAVKRDFRGKGIGSQLLSRALGKLDNNKDISVITFNEECIEGIPARETYKKFGFIEVDKNIIYEGNVRCKMIKFTDAN